MRNLAEYPITTDEVQRALAGISYEINQREVVGDTRPLILSYVNEFLGHYQMEFAEFLIAKGWK